MRARPKSIVHGTGLPPGSGKGAVLDMTKALAKEFGDDGVRVNAIAPGFVITEATANRTPEWRRMFRARALKREEMPADLVGTALYLLSDLSAFVTDQTIVVDGGHVTYCFDAQAVHRLGAAFDRARR